MRKKTVFYSTPYGEDKSGKPQVWVLKSERSNTVCYPVFLSKEACLAFLSAMGRADFIIIEGNLKGALESLDFHPALKEFGLVIELNPSAPIEIAPEIRVNTGTDKNQILDLNMQPLLHKQEPSPQSSQNILDKQFNFPYEIIGKDYPDAIFNIRFSHKVTQKHLEQLEEVLNAFARKQQDTCDDEALIAYIGEAGMLKKDEYTAEIHIDFGSCEPEMIWCVLNELSDSIEHITNVIVF